MKLWRDRRRFIDNKIDEQDIRNNYDYHQDKNNNIREGRYGMLVLLIIARRRFG